MNPKEVVDLAKLVIFYKDKWTELKRKKNQEEGEI